MGLLLVAPGGSRRRAGLSTARVPANTWSLGLRTASLEASDNSRRPPPARSSSQSKVLHSSVNAFSGHGEVALLPCFQQSGRRSKISRAREASAAGCATDARTARLQ